VVAVLIKSASALVHALFLFFLLASDFFTRTLDEHARIETGTNQHCLPRFTLLRAVPYFCSLGWTMNFLGENTNLFPFLLTRAKPFSLRLADVVVARPS
jgi:hypothetical protein